MIPGPPLLKSCPHCGKLHQVPTLTSGNTFGAQIWTDGVMRAPMLPRPPIYVQCVGCQQVVRLDRLNPVEVEDDRFEDAAASARSVRPPTLRAMLNYLGSFSGDAEEETEARLFCWRLGNDERRREGTTPPMTAGEQINLDRLLALLDPEDPAQSLLVAEVYRELGRFEASLAVIESERYDHDHERAAAVIERLARARDPLVREISREGDDPADDARQWQRIGKSVEPVEDFDPSGPPVFEIQSRDWWVKVLGMLDHNWALIEADNGGRFTVYFFHDEGYVGGLGGGHTLRQLDNRNPVIDSVDFDSMEAAMQGLRHNGFDRLEESPGPWSGSQPNGVFFDGRPAGGGIYSRPGGFWRW